MEKNNNLIQLQNHNWGYMIMGTSYQDPVIDNRENIEEILTEKNYRGKVLIDLVLKNGLGSNRYFEIRFDGERLIDNSIKAIKDCSLIIKKISSEFYRNNKGLLENSVLSRLDKDRLLENFPRKENNDIEAIAKVSSVLNALAQGKEIELGNHIYIMRENQIFIKGTLFKDGLEEKSEDRLLNPKIGLNVFIKLVKEKISENDITLLKGEQVLTEFNKKERTLKR